MAYTKEQRAAKAAQEQEQRAETVQLADKPTNVWMCKDGIDAEVANNASVAIMQSLGWALKD